tara:strand:+ start:17088 stop:17261 length:174 start_codon:yes stop_codon:yes gene_type:complete
MPENLKAHRYVDKPTVAFERDSDLSKPFIISMTTESSTETVRLTFDEVRYLIMKGWS